MFLLKWPMQFSFQTKQNELNLLIGVNVGIFLLIMLISAIGGPAQFEETYNQILIISGALSGGLVLGYGEYWRLLTSIFLHVDPLHLAFNMLALYQIGRGVKSFYGGKFLIMVYILAGLGGSLLSVAMLDPRIPSVGASGAVFGLLGLLVAGSFKKTDYGIELPIKPANILPLVIYSFMFGLIPNSGINNFAHLGGFLVGLVLGFLFSHQIVTWKPKWQRYLEKGLYYLCLVLLGLSYLAAIVNIYYLFI
jgi:rhomboid protease GluP